MHTRIRADADPPSARVPACPGTALRSPHGVGFVAILPVILLALASALPRALAHDSEPAPGEAGRDGAELGVVVRDIPSERLEALALGHGVEVAGVMDDSPASRAKIAPGDVLVSMDGLPLYSAERLKWLVSKQQPDKTLSLSVRREGAPPGEMTDIAVTLDPVTTTRQEEVAAVGRAWLGIRVQAMTNALRAAQGVPAGEGVLVADVVEGSPAAKAGLAAGDIITGMDRRTIRSPRDVYRSVDFFDPGETMEVTLSRDGESRKLGVALGDMGSAAGMRSP